MRSFGIIFGVLFSSLVSASTEDVVHLKPRGVLKGQIVEIDDEKLRLRISLAGGAGSSVRLMSMESVRLIDFAPLPGEEELLAAGAAAPKDQLTALWAAKRQHLGRPNSNAGEVGLTLGKVLLASGDETDLANARNLYTIIEGGDWDPKRRALAKRGRLNALVKLGAAEEVLAEAQKIAAEGDDPALLLEARHVLAMAEYEKLRQLVEENPVWREDDGVRPEVEAAYHELLDRFLAAFLFYGTEQEAAARGLKSAADVYRLIGQPERAQECVEDILTLYPDTPQAAAITAAREGDKPETHEKTDPEE